MDYQLDKSDWADGPWMNEPDYLHVVDDETGLDMLIVRNHAGALCGYVGVPKEHPAYEKNYDDVLADVHGGLTYSDHSRGHICHHGDKVANKQVWWLGFDCNHCFDLAPGYESEIRFLMNINGSAVYRDIDYVKAECASLAKQLSEMH